MIRLSRAVVLVAAIAGSLALVTACGGSSGPASPSASLSAPATSPGPVAGASITGTIAGIASGSAAGYAKLDTGSGFTITIAGTGISVAVDGQGKFVLTGVPAGTVQLLISGNGVSATITLEGVKATDQIVVKITLKGASATVDAEQRNGLDIVDLEGRVSAVNPAGATRTLLVESTNVSVPETAVIRHGDTAIEFTAIAVGDRVHVKGTMSGALMIATEVKVQNTNANVAVNVSGAVSSVVTGHACPALWFMLAGWTVETSSATDFGKATCASIAAGTSVHVKGAVQDTGRVLATWVQLK